MSQPGDRPAISSSPLSVVLLTHPDYADQDEVVAAWAHYLDGLKRDYEILLVSESDSSPSGDSPAADSGGAARLRALHPSGTPGPGSALRAGIAAARHPLLFYTTCTKDFQPSDLGQLLERIDKVDLVTGYRVWRPPPFWLVWLDRLQRLLTWLILGMAWEPRTAWLGWRGLGRRVLARWVFGVRVRDPECLFRLFRREGLAGIPIQCDSAFAHVEILAKANFLGRWMSEVPVTCLPSAKNAGGSRIPRKEIYRLFQRPDFGSRSTTRG